MRLRYTVNSPFARKVRIVSHELGIADKIELISTELRAESPGFWAENPVAKVPVLVTDEGLSLFDSNVICEYLDSVYGANKLLPVAGNERWKALTRIALSDAVAEAAILARYELSRPAVEQSKVRIEQELGKVSRGLGALQESVRGVLPGQSVFPLDSIAAVSAVGWIELRFGAEFVFAERPALARWWSSALERPSMMATRTVPGA